MEQNKVYLGDCLEIIKTFPDNSIDSIVTDPPYELGFMGKSWDNTGIANNVDLWRECLRVLKPGGYLLSFSGTRTYHRMASAIEDAGFEVRDMIEWCYGSGFPKSLNIGKAVDKLQGKELKSLYIPNYKNNNYGKGLGGGVTDNTPSDNEWNGWGTALKPAHEPICMARKPLSEKTIAENCLKWGTGGINIDESRVETSDNLNGGGYSKGEYDTDNNVYELGLKRLEGKYQQPIGRFPANLIHDNSEEVRECFPETKSGKAGIRTSDGFNDGVYGKGMGIKAGQSNGEFGDSGNASRFFKSILYYPKASKSERNKGCEELEGKFAPTMGDGIGVKEHNPETATPKQNFHPTVKNLALMEYLIKMVTKEGGIVLDPFAGSGTTLVAAKQNGYNYIGCELTEEYIPIIEARLNFILNK